MGQVAGLRARPRVLVPTDACPTARASRRPWAAKLWAMRREAALPFGLGLLAAALFCVAPGLGCDRGPELVTPSGASASPASAGSGGVTSNGGGSVDLTLQAIAAGEGHTCGLRADGSVICWGRNRSGQLGDGSQEDRGEPVVVSGLSGAVELALGDEHSCARLDTGEVKCWGSNARGQLGDGSSNGKPGIGTTRPVAVRALTDATALVSGGNHVCATRETGSIVCWGDNAGGQLGLEGRSMFNAPAALTGITEVETLVAGKNHTCALRTGGGLLCWGKNNLGQLGDGTKQNRGRPGKVRNIEVADAVAAGGDSTCAITGGQLRCWGGMGGVSPRLMADMPTPVELELGSTHGCARLGASTLCFGANPDGRLGDGSTEDRKAPVKVAALGAVKDLALGMAHSCALEPSGQVSCWGGNDRGALGNGPPSAGLVRPQPGPVVEVTEARAVDNGDRFSCAVQRDGKVLCWGANDKGQLGDGTTKARSRPMAVQGIEGAVDVSTGTAHACAAMDSGKVACWGRNDEGQLGDGTKATQRRPVLVKGVNDAVEVTSGETHTCARRRAGGVVCWGANESGELGGGTTNPVNGSVVAVKGLSDAVQLAAGAHHTCARRASGSVACWGSNARGQIGNGAGASQLKFPVTSPAPVTKVTGATRVDAGPDFSCASTQDGKAQCWGGNAQGQLGSGTASTVWTTRVPVKNAKSVATVGVGDTFTCVVSTSGQLGCWGQNDAGQLGRSPGAAAPTLQPGPSLSGVAQLVAGKNHACARLQDGGLRCWGANHEGQLGDGGRAFTTTPTPVSLP